MEWSALRVVLRAETPLSFRATRDPEKSVGVDYLPGPSLFGALAAAHRLLRPEETREFDDLFGHDGIRVSNGYPAEPGSAAELLSGAAVRPAPLTAATCKRQQGFENAGGHGVRDRLFALAAFVLSGREEVGPLTATDTCPVCRQPADHFSGFCRRGGDGVWRSSRACAGSVTRVQISDLTGAAEPGALYSLQTLAEGTLFAVDFAGERSKLETLRDFLEAASAAGVLRVGTNRTRAFGGLGIEAAGKIAPAAEEAGLFEGRLRRFDEGFRTFCAAHEVEASQAFYFSITLLSDLVMPDGGLRYVQRLEPGYLGLGAPVRLLCHAAAGRRVHGWSSLWRMPKADEMAVAKGSVFFYACDASPGQGVLKTLRGLGDRGLGKRLREGFGLIAVSDSFHLELGGSE